MYSKRKRKAQRIRAYPYLPDARKHPDDPAIRGGLWKTRRLCSAYMHDEQNWLFSNYSDFKELDQYYEDRWSEYYGSRL